MNLYKIKEIVKGISNDNLDIPYNDIVIDSRIVKEGDIFICIIGKNLDGHNFINEAIEKKAACIIVSSDIEISIPSIKVDDTLIALENISKYFINKYRPKVIGITGSNGKTTTKELICDILSTKYNVLKNDGNKNNIYGLTTTILNLKPETEILVLEMGMNHEKEISRLSKICNPDIGIITNIGTSHIGLLNGKKNIFKAKLEIKDGMDNGILIVNGDDKYLKKVKGSYKCGINHYNDLIAYNIYSNNDILTFNIFLDKEYQIKFNNPIKYFISDILLAIKTCLMFNIDISAIVEKISEYKMMDKRMNIIKLNNNVLINDCYNSSFESLLGGLQYLKRIYSSKLIILGDILELGKYSKKIHKKIKRYLNCINNKIVLTVGKSTRYINGVHFDNNDDLIKYINNLEIENCYIYVKGSRKMNLESVIEYFIEKRAI